MKLHTIFSLRHMWNIMGQPSGYILRRLSRDTNTALTSLHGQVDFAASWPRESGKNRSTDVSNISNNSYVGNTTALIISKRTRVYSASNEESILLEFVDSAAMAGNDENHSVDSCSLKDQFSKMETLLDNKLGKLEGKVGVSESNLSARLFAKWNSFSPAGKWLPQNKGKRYRKRHWRIRKWSTKTEEKSRKRTGV